MTFKLCGFAIALLALAAPATAQDAVVIDGAGTKGVLTINVAAGDGNQQANAGAVASGDLVAGGHVLEQLRDHDASASAGSSVVLADGAFAGSAGWVAISGVSGNGNQTANLATILFGTDVPAASDDSLVQHRASPGPAGTLVPTSTSDRDVRFGEGALGGSTGVVQVSLVGGDNNTSANSFALRVDTGGD